MNADDPRRFPLQHYLRQCSDALRLQAWDIEVGNREPDLDTAVLSTQPDPSRWWAPVYVRTEHTEDLHTTFFEETPEEQRQDVAHELVHLILWPLWSVIDDGSWRHQLTRREYDLVHETGLERLEAATEFLARCIAPTLPMPPTFPGTPPTPTLAGTNGHASDSTEGTRVVEVRA